MEEDEGAIKWIISVQAIPIFLDRVGSSPHEAPLWYVRRHQWRDGGAGRARFVASRDKSRVTGIPLMCLLYIDHACTFFKNLPPLSVY